MSTAVLENTIEVNDFQRYKLDPENPQFEVTYTVSYVYEPGYYSGPPEDCHPGYEELEIYDIEIVSPENPSEELKAYVKTPEFNLRLRALVDIDSVAASIRETNFDIPDIHQL